jgi:CBS domain-containing protein
MVATEAGRVPIVDRTTGRIVGLMTRKDLMRTRGDARSAESDRLSYFLRKRKVSATTA